ncbi:helix-turn-helix transcriptional regulator [Pseudomonas monsensis]|uniref:helix-turn-helix transcriptional regulator n=1 Tax=Pseudomonas glycinae TaxID=1785145 RepID=UPI001C89FE71|nr:AlpA family phage regulatory protein [Pseudomonas glycinae]MBX8626017.1 AlpA family phage regulatory protein [Pseudomonas glycinae]
MHNIHAQQQTSASTTQNFDPAITLIRMPDLEAITGLARPTVYKRLKDDPTFPRPVPLSNSKSRGSPVGFVLAEVQAWVRQRIALRGEAA